MDLKAVGVITNKVPQCVVCDASRSVLVDCMQVCLQTVLTFFYLSLLSHKMFCLALIIKWQVCYLSLIPMIRLWSSIQVTFESFFCSFPPCFTLDVNSVFRIGQMQGQEASVKY